MAHPNEPHNPLPCSSLAPASAEGKEHRTTVQGVYCRQHLQGLLIFKASFHIFLIKQLIQIQNQLHKSNIIPCWRLQGFLALGWEHRSPRRALHSGAPGFFERFIGFHSPLRGNPLNVFAIISLITLPALGHSLDLTEIRNSKLLSQYQAINLCHLAVTVAQENNVVS